MDGQKKNFEFVVLCGLFVGIIAVWLYYGGHEAAIGNADNKFTSISALFSGLAFIGMLYALSMQRRELSLQRKELTLTRQELSRTALATEASADAAKKQIKAQHMVIQMNQGWEMLQKAYSIKDDAKRAEARALHLGNMMRASLELYKLYYDGPESERLAQAEAELGKTLNEFAEMGGRKSNG